MPTFRRVEGGDCHTCQAAIAKDASVEHLAKMLDTFEHTPEAEKTWDASASETEQKAMEKAGQGSNSLDLKGGNELADKPKKFGDAMRAWAKDKGLTFGDEDFEAFDKMHADCMDESAEEAEDEEEDDPGSVSAEEGEDGVVEEGAEEAEDAESEEDQEEVDERDRKDKAAKPKESPPAKDRKSAKDRKKGAMDKRGITQDDMNKAISSAVATAQKQARATAEAREFVAPYVGKLPLALDSAEKILRSAAKAMDIEDADTVHHSALKQLIKMAGQSRIVMDQAANHGGDLAFDSFSGTDSGSFDEMFPDANRIGMV